MSSRWAAVASKASDGLYPELARDKACSASNVDRSDALTENNEAIAPKPDPRPACIDEGRTVSLPIVPGIASDLVHIVDAIPLAQRALHALVLLENLLRLDAVIHRDHRLDAIALQTAGQAVDCQHIKQRVLTGGNFAPSLSA